MPYYAKTHTQFCSKLCLLCLSKGPSLTPIRRAACSTSKHDYVAYIRNSWWKDYDVESDKFPRVLCVTCRIKLAKNNDPVILNPPTLPPKLMYENLVFKPKTRLNLEYDCDISASMGDSSLKN